ncbi:AAA family ATPase [Aliarcobacter cryaerophilus]|uniref:AAA family ATPase n=1 Tax=Aliarcobacter cryaerophilus TaxID=28198 RepID=UPI003BAE474D
MDYNINYSIECLLGIERAILSSLITDNGKEKIEESMKIIESNDFYYEQHGIVYDTIISLHKNDQRVDENNVFLSNQKNINEQYYIDIIATTPLDSITDSNKKLKEYSLKRQITTIASKIKDGNFSQISKLQELQDKLENLVTIKTIKKIDDKFEKFISQYDLDIKKIRNKKIEYLYDDFIIKNDITMIVSRPGIGKSLISVALCNMFLSNEKIKRVIYLDGDNSMITIKSRNIDVLKEKFGNKLYYILELSDSDLYRIIAELKKKDLSYVLVIFDSIKNFIIGDRNSHKDVTEIMNILKKLRNNGATIIFLHHQNKLNKEFNSAFAGSSAFMEDISLAYELKKNEDKQTYIFTPLKDRNNISNSIAFVYNQDNTIEKVDLDYAIETNEDVEIRELILNFIESRKEKPIYSDILKYLENSGYNKDKANKIIQSGKNKYWKSTRMTQNNKLVFELQDNSDNQDKSFLGAN